MAERLNAIGQPIGAEVAAFEAQPLTLKSVDGAWCRLEPLDVDAHANSLFEAYEEDSEQRVWTYLAYGPFESLAEYEDWLRANCFNDDVLFFAILDRATGRALGVASYLRVEPAVGSAEIGHVAFAPALQRSRVASEAMFLMIKQLFDLGYRRCEWKCDALNAGSARAARRFGFTWEGKFRQATLYKGRNRDTAWFAMLDYEWPRLEKRFEAWLAPSNFDAAGLQEKSLGEFRDSTSELEGLTFREASRTDLPRVVELLADDALGQTRESVSAKDAKGYERAFEAIQASTENTLLVAEFEGEIAGVLQLTIIPNLTHSGSQRAQIEGVRVSREHRGAGLGQQLIREAIRRAREQGCGMVQLTTDRQRGAITRFYESLGFQSTHWGMKLRLSSES